MRLAGLGRTDCKAHLPTLMLPFAHTFFRGLPAVQDARLDDRFGHDADGHERLLNRGELDHLKADCR
jgi:hypothetical protein